MSYRTAGRILTRAISRSTGLVRGLWYRRVYLSWVSFGRRITFAGPIRCAGVTGSITIGDRAFLGANISLAVADGGRLAIGNDVSINQGTVLSARGAIAIGNGTRIGENCSIRDSDHRLDPEQPVLESGFFVRPVTIGNHVWIGRHVTIQPGVSIGDGAVIGAHSLVNSDIPARVVAFGIPARLHRELT